MNKILIASFIFPERIDWFLGYLENKFKIRKEDVFIFKIINDESKYMVTFKFKLDRDNRINIKDLFPSAIPIHKRGNAIYTINALNRLIERLHGGDIGNINHKDIKIEWVDYQNKLILIKENDLVISNIERIFI